MKIQRLMNVLLVVRCLVASTDLKTHCKIIHEKNKEYKCDSCDKMFGRKSNLKGHSKNIHAKFKASSLKIYFCDNIWT